MPKTAPRSSGSKSARSGPGRQRKDESSSTERSGTAAGKSGRKSLQLSEEQHAELRELSEASGFPMSKLHDWAVSLLRRAPEFQGLLAAVKAAEEACSNQPR